MLPQIDKIEYQWLKYRIFWAAVILWVIATPVQSAWQAPLSENEKSTAESIALLDQSNQPTGLRDADQSAQHPLGVQVLLVEPRELKNPTDTNEKVAEVFVFNHNTHLAERTLVNLSSGTVIETQKIAGVHLPLSEEEIEYSINAVRNNPDVQARLQREHESIGHSSTDDVMSQLQLRVSIWVPLSAEYAGNSGCDIERCVLVSLFDAQNLSYTTEPTVNLKTNTVSLDLIQ